MTQSYGHQPVPLVNLCTLFASFGVFRSSKKSAVNNYFTSTASRPDKHAKVRQKFNPGISVNSVTSCSKKPEQKDNNLQEGTELVTPQVICTLIVLYSPFVTH